MDCSVLSSSCRPAAARVSLGAGPASTGAGERWGRGQGGTGTPTCEVLGASAWSPRWLETGRGAAPMSPPHPRTPHLVWGHSQSVRLPKMCRVGPGALQEEGQGSEEDVGGSSGHSLESSHPGQGREQGGCKDIPCRNEHLEQDGAPRGEAAGRGWHSQAGDERQKEKVER